MAGDARDFNNIETRNVIKSPPLQGKALKEIHAIVIDSRETRTIVCQRQKLGGPV